MRARGDDRAGIAREQREEVELLRRQVDLTPVDGDAAAARSTTSGASSELLAIVLRRGRPPRDRADPRDSSRNPKGLTM